MLSTLTNERMIQLRASADNWQDAIFLAAKPLVETGAVNKAYVTAMIDSVKQYGPYIVLLPHLAMPHARPDQGALRTAISIMTLARPVAFGHPENDPVSYILCLSAADDSSHLEAMAQLVSILEQQSFFDVLDHAREPLDVMKYIRKAEQEV